MKSRKISVVIPVYNRKEELLRAVKSVLIQTQLPLEIIIIDDCSNFDVSKLLRSEINDSIIKVISNNINMGAAKSRNIGIKAAVGEYVAFLDSDDYWYKTKLARQYEIFTKNTNLDLVYTDQLLDRDNRLFPSGKELINNQLVEKLINGWTGPNTSTLMFKKSSLIAVNGFNEVLQSCQDHDLWFKLAKSNMKVDYVSEALSVFVLGSSNRISYNLEKRMAGVNDFLRIWEKYITKESSNKSFSCFQNEYVYKTSYPIFVMEVKNKDISKSISIFFNYLIKNNYFYKHIFELIRKRITLKTKR
jgi:glycosyltransferase involved in cell wall biosynthesis